MKHIIKNLSILFVVCLAISCSKKDDDNVQPYAKAKGQVQELVNAAVVNDFPGISISVKSRNYNYTVIAGKANLANENFTANTLNYMHSISKTFTAVAILQLKEQGLINLDSAIKHYLSPTICNNIANGNMVTVRQLLNMQSGIPDYFDNPQFIMDAQAGPLPMPSSQMLQYVYNRPAHFAPGTNYEYANINYHLLALIIDKVIQGNHRDYITNHIINPYHLTQTYYVPQSNFNAPPANTASSYSSAIIPGQITDVSALQFGVVKSSIGDDGIIASTSDIAAFYKLLLQDKTVLGTSSLREMTGPESTLGQGVYGMGLYSYRIDSGQLAIGHTGGLIGGSAVVMYFPDNGITIAMATNIGAIDETDPAVIKFYQLWNKIAKIILEAS